MGSGMPGNASPTLPGNQPGAIPGLGNSAVFISGKVSLADGGELTDSVAIQTICRGQHHTVTYTDRRGSFSFQFGNTGPAPGGDVSDASSNVLTSRASAQEARDWQDCEVQAVLAGFSSQPIELSGHMSMLESTDLGPILLHRLSQVEGTSISVTTALAPGPARKSYEKGRDEEKKGKWDAAEQSFQKAVQIYPKYAVAWFELGRVQMQKNDYTTAQHSFEQSVAADAMYVNPYDGLAQLAFHNSEWLEVVRITDKLLTLNSVNFPGDYLLNGLANYHLRNVDAAEASARHGIKVDEAHQVPKLHFLLGMVLMQKRDYAGATEAMQQFLHWATQPSDVTEANKQLAEIARLSAAPNNAAVTERK